MIPTTVTVNARDDAIRPLAALTPAALLSGCGAGDEAHAFYEAVQGGTFRPLERPAAPPSERPAAAAAAAQGPASGASGASRAASSG